MSDYTLNFEDIKNVVPCDHSNSHVLFLVRTMNGLEGWCRLHREDFIELMIFLSDEAGHMKRKN